MPALWTRSARRDFRAQVEYLAEQSPMVARRFRTTIREAVERLADHPYRGRPGRRDGTRELVIVIVGLPYIVIYRVRESRIEVLRVLHSAQDWP